MVRVRVRVGVRVEKGWGPCLRRKWVMFRHEKAINRGTLQRSFRPGDLVALTCSTPPYTHSSSGPFRCMKGETREDKRRQEQDTTRHDMTRPRHDTTRHDTTRQDKTRQNKTRQKKPISSCANFTCTVHSERVSRGTVRVGSVFSSSKSTRRSGHGSTANGKRQTAPDLCNPRTELQGDDKKVFPLFKGRGHFVPLFGASQVHHGLVHRTH